MIDRIDKEKKDMIETNAQAQRIVNNEEKMRIDQMISDVITCNGKASKLTVERESLEEKLRQLEISSNLKISFLENSALSYDQQIKQLKKKLKNAEGENIQNLNKFLNMEAKNLVISDDSVKMQTHYFQTIQQLQTEGQGLQMRYNELQTSLAETQNKLSFALNEKDNQQKTHQEQIKYLNQKESILNNTLNENQRLLNELDKIKSIAATTTQDLKKSEDVLKNDINQSKILFENLKQEYITFHSTSTLKIQELEEILRNKISEIETLQKLEKEHENTNHAVFKKLKQAEASLLQYKNINDDSNQKIQELNNLISKLNHHIDSTRFENNTSQSVADQLKIKLKDAEDKINKLSTTKFSLESTLKNFEEETNILKDQISQLNQFKQQQEDRLNNEQNQLNQETQALQEEITRLNTQLKSEQNNMMAQYNTEILKLNKQIEMLTTSKQSLENQCSVIDNQFCIERANNQSKIDTLNDEICQKDLIIYNNALKHQEELTKVLVQNKLMEKK
jgi:chromosome segregation ATPase